MKHIKYIFATLLLVLLGQRAAADNKLVVNDLTAMAASTELTVSLENSDDIVGVQFDITLPEGTTIVEEPTLSNRASDHVAAVRPVDGSAQQFRVLVFSPSGNAFTGNNGEILTLPIVLSTNLVKDSEHDVTLDNVIIGKADGSNATTGTTPGKITIGAQFRTIFNLNVGVSPSNSGSLNRSSSEFELGSSIYMNAYANTDFQFVNWTENGRVVSTNQSFYYTMPAYDVQLIANFAFKPGNPNDPDAPEQTKTYKLTLGTWPANAGSFNRSSDEYYKAGESIYMYYYNNEGFTFRYWQSGDTVVSRERYFNFTMPDHDATLTAVYDYTPGSPADPDTAQVYYTVSLETQPANAGSFSWNTTTQRVAGSSGYIYAYNNTDFAFREWQQNGKTVGTDRQYNFIMPAQNIKLVAVYDYVPSNPGNPGKNYWSEETGEIIIDDFTAGNLSSAVSNTIGGSSNRDKVQMITVAGPVSQYDWGVVNNYGNCTFLDMSRTYGMTYVPSYNFSGNQVLTTVALPAGIETIDYYAFNNCTSLSSLSIYAATPPTIGNRAFQGVPDGLIVYVPADAISLYQEAEGWKDFTILPLASQVSSLEVNLNDNQNFDITPYKDMFVELINTVSGQKQRYVVTNRVTYTFNSLPKRTNYNVYLRNGQGDVLGQIDDVAVGYDGQGDVVSVTFSELKVPRDLTLTVLTPEGADVTSQTTITWYDRKDTYLTKGSTLTAQLDGVSVKYRVQLPQSLAMLYQLPADATYEVQATNSISLTLTAIPQTTIGGRVIDVKTGQPLSGATVAVSQMLNGLYSKSFTTKTDNKGQWSLLIYEAKTDITASMDDYVSKTQSYEMLVAEVPDFELKDISGTTIAINLTYQPTGGELQEYYSDYANVAYTVYNATAGKNVTELNVQYPQIVLMEQLPAGTVLRITATSKNQKFVPVTATATVDSLDRASVTLPIVQLGGIVASFRQTDNPSVVGILYDGNGRLLKKYEYASATLNINELQDGQYALITMASTQLFSTVGSLSQFAEAGLREGVDYIRNSVTVESGKMAAIDNALIPYLDETKLYYTGDGTSISVNKSQITTGNYLTITGHIDFKAAYADQVSDLKLIVDLPEECAFVDNSVMRGAQTATYTYADNQVVVPLDYYGERVRFCFIPTMGGDFTTTGSIQFTLNGKTITQPIGNANFTVKDLSISVPSIVAKTTVPVSGTAPGKSIVDIYDNDTYVGQTKALASGSWTAYIELEKPYNLSIHSIHAKLSTTNGLEMLTETKDVLYDMNCIEARTVTMSFFNGWLKKNIQVVFDLQNKTIDQSSYMFYTTTDITFVADLTNNDTTFVNGVTIRVYTDKNNWRELKASYDKKFDRWVAVSQFTSSELPVGVKVRVDALSQPVLDTDQMSNLLSVVRNSKSEMDEASEETQSIVDSINEELAKDELDENRIKMLLQSFNVPIAVGERTDSLSNLSDDELLAYIDKLCERTDIFLSDQVNQYNELLEEYKSLTNFEFSAGENTYKVEISQPYTTDVSTLLADGFRQIQTTTGYSLYEKFTIDEYVRIDLVENTCLTMRVSYSTAYNIRRALSGTEKGSIAAAVADATASLNWIKGKLTDFQLWFTMEKNKKWVAIVARDSEIANALKELESRIANTSGFGKLALIEKRIALLAERATITAKWAAFAKAHTWALRTAGAAIGSITNIVICLYSEWENCKKIESLSIPSCLYTYNLPLAQCYAAEKEQLYDYVVSWTYWTIARCVVYAAGDVVLSESVIIPIALTILECWAEISYSRYKQKEFDNMLSDLKSRMRKSAKEYCKDDDDDDDDDDDGDDDPPYPQIPPIHDPSGFVYEGVASNRLQGVTATAYYKETVEDMYGDLHENVVLWNAEEYAQENPLFTDEYGMYQWDVPQGLWQVKFEKEGYQTTYSEWLPVPPPQLEVNIPMTQMLQPTVKSGLADSKGVEVTFDKYMDPATLTTDNIFVTKNGTKITDGTIELLDEEVAYEGKTETFASKVRFNVPDGDENLLLSTDEVMLTVKKTVKSYAGVQMQDDYTQKFDVEPRVASVAVDELLNIGYGAERTITVAALPTDASKGKKMKVQSLSTMIASVSSNELTLDENGQAELTISGELPGSTVINFQVEDTDVKGLTSVNVKDAALLVTVTPRASRVSGTEVYRGTSIRLTCETENADIYYTLDGSCPCNIETAIKYNADEPIVINDDEVTIKAMAQGHDLAESEVAEFSYSLKKSMQGYQMPAGWTWLSHNMEQAVPVSEFETNAERILSQTDEVIKDPVLGMMGTLTELQPAKAYKVKVSANTEKQLKGYEYNATANPVGVTAGWNWIGYPVNQTMTLNEALAFFTPGEGDYIVGQDGFAEFADDQWNGTLEGLVPGRGYLYKSAVSTEIVFNTAIVSTAGSRINKRNLLMNSPWAVDKHGYANVMPLTAYLYNNGVRAAEDEYLVGAFADTACRGIGLWKNGRVMMSVYGNNGDALRFVAVDKNSDAVYDITETLTFTSTNVGSWNLPYTLTLGNKSTNIEQLYSELSVTPVVARDHITVSAGGRQISKLTMTNMGGQTVLSVSNLGKGATVTTTTLPEGMYIVTVQAEGQTYYKKILKANK